MSLPPQPDTATAAAHRRFACRTLTSDASTPATASHRGVLESFSVGGAQTVPAPARARPVVRPAEKDFLRNANLPLTVAELFALSEPLALLSDGLREREGGGMD